MTLLVLEAAEHRSTKQSEHWRSLCQWRQQLQRGQLGAVVAGLGHQLSAAESQWAGDLVTMVGQGCRSRTMRGTGQGGHHWQQTPPQDLPTIYSIGQVVTFIISYQNTFYDLLSGQRYELTCEATVGGGREENFNNSFYLFIITVMFFIKYSFHESNHLLHKIYV